jgi:hypothetical protein
VKIDVNRHCVDVPLCGVTERPIELSTETPDLLQVLKEVVDSCASSVVVSWPDTHLSRTALTVNTLEGALTTGPFFMLDGGGRRMATLTLLSKQANEQYTDDDVLSKYQEPVGTWLRELCFLRTATT